jgi:hypothetical protein
VSVTTVCRLCIYLLFEIEIHGPLSQLFEFQHNPRDNVVLDFGGAFTDAHDTGIAHVTFHGQALG